MKANYRHLAEDVNLSTLKAHESAFAEDGSEAKISGVKHLTGGVSSPNSGSDVEGCNPDEHATFQLLRNMIDKISTSRTVDISKFGIDPRCIVVDKEAGTVTILPYPIIVGNIEEGE